MHQQSPWQKYFGQMQKKSSNEPARHPVVVALTVIGLLSIITAAFLLRLNLWYFGEISVLPLCTERKYNYTLGFSVSPINEPLAYLLTFSAAPFIVLCIELVYFIVSFDENYSSPKDGDDTAKPRLVKGIYLFLFRFLHFVAVLLLTAAFVSVFVDVTKIVFDWHRPYFLTKFPFNCDSSFVELNPRRALSPEEINARQGFPSYRVALLSSVAVLLSIHSFNVLQKMRSSGPFQALVVLTSVMAPLLASASVLNSRENRPEDVIFGLLVGVITAAYMASMLPKKLVWTNSESGTSRPMPKTIEELDSFSPMRQGISYNLPRSSLMGRNSNLDQRHTLSYARIPVPLPE